MTQTVKLISEEIQDVEYICEEKEDGKKGEQSDRVCIIIIIFWYAVR